MAEVRPGWRCVLFETSDDGLAAFLRVRGCRYLGLGAGEATDPAPEVTHLFDDDPAKITPLVGAFLSCEGDDVSATALLAALWHLAAQRRDQGLRLRRQAESDLMKVRGGGEGGGDGVGSAGWGGAGGSR